MRDKNLKIISLLIIFLFLDIIKPFGYFLHTEFLFLGILLLSFEYPLILSCVLNIIFGYLKDALSVHTFPLSLIEFPVITILVHYLMFRFNRGIAKIFICMSIVVLHIGVNICVMKILVPKFMIFFFIHSVLTFLIVNFLYNLWAKPLSAKYI
jgi:cell shape-determining protein MreD